MKKFFRKYRRIFYLFATIIFIIIALSARSMYRNTIIEKLNIQILDSTKLKLVTKNTLIEYIKTNYDKQIIGEKYKNINISEISEILAKNPFIKEFNIYRNDNIINIQVTQKKPVVRIIDKANSQYYIDEQGDLLPLNTNFSAYTIIANGNIPHLISKDSISGKNVLDSIFKNSNLPQIFQLVKKIKSNDFADKLVDQIYINNNNEFILIPRIGKFKINIGTIKDLNLKLINLEAFYKEILPTTGWNKFSEINLTHINQIICKKVKQ